MFSPYLGKVYTAEDILQSIELFKGKIEVNKTDNVYYDAALDISQGNIIGWFQDGSECGPRALGNRSILGDPRISEMKGIINSRVKFREPFRPFAPSILWEFQSEYFDLDIPSPYMLMIADIWPEAQKKIPAVTHVDGTGRLQTVMKDLNEKYYKLIYAFYEITGVPVVLNTSYNINKEPIVETPADAIRCFLGSDFDVIYIHNYKITRIKGGVK